MHEVLVNRLGGLSLPRKSVVRLTDRPDMTLDVYRVLKTTIQQLLDRTERLLFSQLNSRRYSTKLEMPYFIIGKRALEINTGSWKLLNYRNTRKSAQNNSYYGFAPHAHSQANLRASMIRYQIQIYMRQMNICIF